MPELNISDINKFAIENPIELVRQSEEEYHSLVDKVAEKICSDKKIRILLLAGPSGSGKTTTANLICDRIRAHGEECIVVSLDDFYRDFDDPDYPRLPDGTRDCEAVEALDIPCLTESLRNIAESKPFILPKYDFKPARRVDERTHAPMPDGCVIIEGLHALSPMIFSSLPEQSAFKLFISVSTNINSGQERILSGRKIRFIRRMVRDSLYRNASAERTLSMWKNVLVGEDKYLYPNRKYADMSFNTFHPFELSVTRRFVENLISEELSEREPYAKTVLNAAKMAEPIDISLVPETSLIREFIPGGKYESLY